MRELLGRVSCYFGFHRVVTTRNKPKTGGSTIHGVCYRPNCHFAFAKNFDF